MSKNKKIWIAVAAAVGLLIAIVAIARSDEVDRDAVLRCGDMVQHISGYGQSATDRFVEAMAPPKDDSGKWYISVIGSSRSQTCARLKDDWARDANLLAIANPGDPSRSWAHWHYYHYGDKSQAWRFEKVKITHIPTVIVQPPRDGSYGDPSTVVCQLVGYNGDAASLAAKIRGSIRAYVAKLKTVQPPATNTGRLTPPWTPAPKVDPPLDEEDDSAPVHRIFPDIDIPSDIDVQVGFPWREIMTFFTVGFTIPAVIALVIWIVVIVRNWRKETGRKLYLSDETFGSVIKMLEDFAGRFDPKPEEPEEEKPKVVSRSKPRSTRKKATKKKTTG